ncbi:thioredoxin family protein [Patescibacteria group bacterium]|nr:thioredoxin family protein [Patescibacteria group bacterium]MBU1500691.1 thioredoxin family protein [Patescibacteria group bacterium]MBU2080756.1 thioredoxin family protein [Patescibacteria group bacterium]MBU2123861.1 thioredoxin family protein [Patescibacteria group bacterium]MBU2194848.1 thioredoxin family protein [Patescibacteria group bacterium]
MNKTAGISIAVVALIAIAGFAYASMNKSADVSVKDETSQTGEKDMSTEEGMEKGEDMMKTGLYEAYAPEKLARAKEGDVVLFFHATWCPSCRGLNADIENNLEAIPANVSILKLDYDTETELKKKYGVTTQHTLVQVDAEGNLIKKWSGSPTLTGLVGSIQ